MWIYQDRYNTYTHAYTRIPMLSSSKSRYSASAGAGGGASSLQDIFQSLYFISFYSPQIIVLGILMFSLFSVAIDKFAVYMLWFFVITFLRVVVVKLTGGVGNTTYTPPAICKTGLSQMFITNDVTYSTYILTFTLFYLIMPMILTTYQTNHNIINYYVMSFLTAYILFDLFVKRTLFCVPSLFSVQVISDVLAGAGLGALIAGPIMFGSAWQKHLFLNETSGDGTVCSVPSKQQFKCSVYKNGELVSSTVKSK